ncbi:MAG: CDP-glycerol glycerophosphotransferase family protein [Paraglaciecola sp.]|uniref:CDP-glycerol glycerophosphotransferase family protein n=1 Tax=Paraglaciecola sp. TaxID=1920173 RepID=UPI00329A569D
MIATDAELVICASLSPCSPVNTKKITMLYDSILLENAKHNLAQAKEHYIAVPSAVLMAQLKRICIKHHLKNVILIPSGYPKLDYAIKNFKSNRSTGVLYMLYAPTEFAEKSADDLDGAFSIFKAKAIILQLLNANPSLNIIFRPYPDDLSRYKLKQNTPAYDSMNDLMQMCNTHSRVHLDNNKTHQQSYEKAEVLLTDISSTAFSFAFTVKKPVIFLSNSVIENSPTWQSTQYMKDRPQIGIVVTRLTDMSKSVQTLLANLEQYTHQITMLRKSNVYNLGNSESYIMKSVQNILDGKSMPNWWSL